MTGVVGGACPQEQGTEGQPAGLGSEHEDRASMKNSGSNSRGDGEMLGTVTGGGTRCDLDFEGPSGQCGQRRR